ncbi:MAG: hypothetical protein HEQ27_05310 [Dolichospermum sp. JUN01]|nr:hypothetical protein [Dolichospermum sp. JUN01]
MYSFRTSDGTRTHQAKVCADTVFYRPIPNAYNNGAYLVAVTNGEETLVNGGSWIYWSTEVDGRAIEQLPNSECPDCVPSTNNYDCLNGVCVSSSTYQTNGIHSTLEECQQNCGGGTGCAAPKICVPPDYCPPGMVCLSAGEFSQIDGLAVALKNSVC